MSELQLAPSGQRLASRSDASGNAAESTQHANSQHDADWLASAPAHHAQAAGQDRQLPQRKKRLRTSKHRNCEEDVLLEESAPLQQDAGGIDNKDDNEKLSPEQHQASISMPGRGHHKQQVIEDDDIMLEEGIAGVPPPLTSGATEHTEGGPALDVVGQGIATKPAMKKASDGLAVAAADFSSALTSQCTHESTTRAAQWAKPAARGSLLDAVMGDDNFGFEAVSEWTKPQGAQPPEIALDNTGRNVAGTSAEQQPTVPPLPHVQQTLAGEQDLCKQDPDLQGHDVLPRQPALTAEQRLHQATSSAPRKSRLRDKMRALGMNV